MAHSYKFAIIRLAPDDARNERLNIGALVFNEDGIDIRLSKRLDKVRSISSALDVEDLRNLVDKLRELDAKLIENNNIDQETRLRLISQVGPLALSDIGTFMADGSNAYEDRISSILKNLIDPEASSKKRRAKKSKLVSQVKAFFRTERVLAKKDEDLSSHRIVSAYELDEGLVADFVLKNGAIHVVETVDASGDEDSLRKTIAEIGVASLVLERARMRFGDNQTKARLVYEASSQLEKIARPSLEAASHQGTELINWASGDERKKFIHSLASLATPIEPKRRSSQIRFSGLH